MPGRFHRIDDELLFRVITGSATETEREALGVWLQTSPDNIVRFRELAAVLEALALDEANMAVPPLPALSSILARAKLAGRTETGERRRPVVGLVTVGLTITILAGAVLWGIRTPAAESASPFGGERFSVGTGNSVAVTLLDGTRVELGPQSTISTDLRNDVREVTLEGRASFVVARQGIRPFMVRTSAGEVRDIGTEFSVRVDRGATHVAVFEGRVGFSNANGAAEAGAGEMIATRPGGRPVVSRLTAGHSSSDWVRAALVFEQSSVTEIAGVLEQTYGVPVQIADPAIGRRTVSAWFVQEPSLEEVFTAVCRAVDAKCSVEGSRRVLSSLSQPRESL